MPPLPSDLRRTLERTIINAREVAVTAAGASLRRMGVEAKEAPAFLSPDERALRLHLRAAARQLGDDWDADRQSFRTLARLEHEVAYEHWHRMLFARFLAENNLLIHPQHGVAVDLATVAELAKEEAGAAARVDVWAAAGRYAAAMLPQIFRPDDPALAVQLAPEHRQALEHLLEALPPMVFTADDALGWVYQFWQSEEKERVNERAKGGEKISGETLPAVTQLFTEHYMVLFLLHNTIGAWHAGKVLASPAGQRQAATCTTEQELRRLVSLPDHPLDYLRFVTDDQSPARWRPAAGSFPAWPRAAKNLKVLDPSCGSGHFLVAVLELLTRVRMAEERLSAKQAALAVIRDNLHGLELDPRCTQLAAFNVALAAWKLAGEHFPVPDMHIACSGLGPNCSQEQWLKLAARQPESVRNTLRDLHDLFSKAPELGSLIDPKATGGTLGAADWETVKPLLAGVLAEDAGGGAHADADVHERAVAAQGMAKAAEILAGTYTLVITNVPYLGAKGQGEELKAFALAQYEEAKADLATVFVCRMLKWVGTGTAAGSIAVVTPQNWLFLTSYRRLRERLLKERTWNMVARLGPKGFQTPMWDFNIMLAILSGCKPASDHLMAGVDVSAARLPSEKASLLRADTSGGRP
jgi:hypothetical protein